ncbi:MAG: hypothetical protein P4L66_13230 [Acetobacteraceae bacterium]|nr:hypothetical protein [Acetobacteraceae bacterium]
MRLFRLRMTQLLAIGALVAPMVLLPRAGQAAWFEICRGLNLVGANLQPVLVPQGSLFRDNGRADDPLADFTGDKWQLRLETIYRVQITQLSNCVRVLVRITSDSSTKSVAATDNRRFVYVGSSNLLDEIQPSEDLMSVRGRVIDSVP